MLEKIKEKRKMMKKYPMFKMDKDIISYYRENINGNRDKSIKEVKRKLSRNIYCGKHKFILGALWLVRYGYLAILVDYSKMEILTINSDASKKGKIDYTLKSKLNNLYKIKESKK